MRLIDKIYIDGGFVTPHGTELFDLHNPATAQVIGRVRLADEEDARAAIAAAKRAFPAFARTSKAERIALLRRMHAAMKARREELLEAIVEEYGAPVSRAGFMADHPANVLLDMARVLEDYRFTRRVGMAEVVMIAIIPAIVNGIAHAIGHRFRTLPVTPERILEVLA